LPVGESLVIAPVTAEDIRAFLLAFPIASGEWESIRTSLDSTGGRQPPGDLMAQIERFYRMAP